MRKGLGKVGQRKIEHVPGWRTNSRLIHEVCVNLFVGAVQNTIVDVVICGSLDTELMPKSLDSEVAYRGKSPQIDQTGSWRTLHGS